MLCDTLFALGLLLSTASQLRPGGSPFGLGEVCLILWLFMTLSRQVGGRAPPLTPAFARMLSFWVVFAFAQSLGSLTGLAIGDKHDPRWVLHDALAYPLIAAVSCTSVIEPDAEFRLHRVAWLLVTIGSACLAVQLGAAQHLFSIPMVEPWYWERLRGWSANPNQLALLCTALGLVSLHLADTARSRGQRTAAVACLILPIYVGRLTQSDTFTLLIGAAGLIYVGLKLRVWILLPERNLTLRTAFAGIAILAFPLLVATAVPLALSTAGETGRLAMGMTKNNGKEAQEEADLRLQLWHQALQRGVDSAMLGLGPGPHLAIPASLVAARLSEAGQPGNIQHPEQNSAPNFEAHNTILDLFVQSGLIGLLSFLWLAATAIRASYKVRLAGLTTLLCGLAIFGMTNLIIRHPLFWFAIAMCLVAGTGRGAASARSWS